MYAIKAEISDPTAEEFALPAQKTMYGGRQIASGVVTSVQPVAKVSGVERQTPRVTITVRRTALVKQRLGRSELKPYSNWSDNRPETELNFKFYRQATNKIAGISDQAAAFLLGFF